MARTLGQWKAISPGEVIRTYPLTSIEDLVADAIAEIVRLHRAADWDDAHREALRDLVNCRNEQNIIGGGPGWQERDRKAWARAFELFEP